MDEVKSDEQTFSFYVKCCFYHRSVGWDIQSKYFPKVTLCDFQIREPLHLKGLHRYTVQCVLPLNLFSQQVNNYY